MNTIIKQIEKILKDGGIEEYKQEARLIVEDISGFSLDKILLGQEIENREKMLDVALKRADTKAPIQHILGFSYFMGEKYIVNPNVLIPRDETEILVSECYKLLKNKNGKVDVLDIGVGSGCISCALAKKLLDKDIEILAVDISFEAIKTALENADKLDLIRKIIFRKSDIYSKIRDCEKFDLIVSNPPYIPLREKDNSQLEVGFEPEIALFAPDYDGVEFYRRIIKDAGKFLKQDGILAFEIGINQSEIIKNILIQNNFKDIIIIKDLANIDRVVIARL